MVKSTENFQNKNYHTALLEKLVKSTKVIWQEQFILYLAQNWIEKNGGVFLMLDYLDCLSHIEKSLFEGRSFA